MTTIESNAENDKRYSKYWEDPKPYINDPYYHLKYTPKGTINHLGWGCFYPNHTSPNWGLKAWLRKSKPRLRVKSRSPELESSGWKINKEEEFVEIDYGDWKYLKLQFLRLE